MVHTIGVGVLGIPATVSDVIGVSKTSLFGAAANLMEVGGGTEKAG